MPDRNFLFHIHAREAGPFVIDAEFEDAVLVGEREGCGEEGGVWSGVGWDEGEAVEGGEHGEF